MSDSRVPTPDNGLDPRVVANYIIERTQGNIRHIALQKLLYFSHCLYLIRFKRPLVKGYFEAWTHGPVHPAVYAAFKNHGADRIKQKALRKDIRTGLHSELPPLADEEAKKVVNITLAAYADMSDRQLVDLSHAKGGPWDIIKTRSQSERIIGLKIPNELIEREFRNHKVSIDRLNQVGDLDDQKDTPLAYNGLS